MKRMLRSGIQNLISKIVNISTVYIWSRCIKKRLVYDKPLYVGSSVLDLSKFCMMDLHWNTTHKNFENKYNLIYSDTDSLVYRIEHPDIYEWIKENKEHFDLSDSIREDLNGDTNMKVLGKFKDEMNTLITK